MNRNDALRLLRLDHAVAKLTPAIVWSAFTAAAKKSHPDNGGFGDMDQLTKAKEFLLANLVEAESTCKLCGGLRMVRGKFGYRPCGGCNKDEDKR